MSLPDVDLSSLTIDERLKLIDALWASIEQSAAAGDNRATKALARGMTIDPMLIAELEREADDAEKDPSSLVPWETLLADLKRKPE
jgi:putative addiction module component (TIGR02574 family)